MVGRPQSRPESAIALPLREVPRVDRRLSDAEASITDSVDTINSKRIEICRQLYMIESERLYREVGVRSFKEYLRLGRVPIPYKTAIDYAKIGSVLVDHAELLDGCRFTESDGLTKLRYLPEALSNHCDQQEVCDQLRQKSFRDFKRYASAADEDLATDGCRDEPVALPRRSDVRLTVEDDTILMYDVDGDFVEVVWLNPEAVSDPVTYGRLITALSDATLRTLTA